MISCNGESSLPRDRLLLEALRNCPGAEAADDGKRFGLLGLFADASAAAAAARMTVAGQWAVASGLWLRRPGDRLPERHLLPLWCVIGLDWPDIGRYIAPTLRLGVAKW